MQPRATRRADQRRTHDPDERWTQMRSSGRLSWASAPTVDAGELFISLAARRAEPVLPG
jgi:hypothetical protein